MKLECVILTIIVFGTIGGFINRFRDNEKESRYWKSIIKGIGAALVVPLFLELVRSDIISKDQGNWYNYFVFGGLCTIAAIFSDKFFDSIGEKLLNKVRKVEKTLRELEDTRTEFDNIDDFIANEVGDISQNARREDIKKIVNAIVNSNYTYRTIKGIQKECNINPNIVNEILKKLKKMGYAKSKKNKNGNDIWKIVIE